MVRDARRKLSASKYQTHQSHFHCHCFLKDNIFGIRQGYYRGKDGNLERWHAIVCQQMYPTNTSRHPSVRLPLSAATSPSNFSTIGVIWQYIIDDKYPPNSFCLLGRGFMKSYFFGHFFSIFWRKNNVLWNPAYPLAQFMNLFHNFFYMMASPTVLLEIRFN